MALRRIVSTKTPFRVSVQVVVVDEDLVHRTIRTVPYDPEAFTTSRFTRGKIMSRSKYVRIYIFGLFFRFFKTFFFIEYDLFQVKAEGTNKRRFEMSLGIE